MMNEKKISTKVNVGGIALKNPVLTSSGTYGYGEEYEGLVDYNLLGGIILKGTYLEPRLGNPPPRTCETQAGMLNSVGLQGVGIKAFIEEKLPRLRKYDTALILNIAGSTVNEYVEIAKRLNDAEGLAGIELNISCPNVESGGMVFGTNPKLTYKVVSAVRSASRLPMIVKLSPNVTDIKEMAKVAEDGGADALSLINTLLGMAIDVRTRRPKLGSITGGLSGPAIRPVAVRMVWEAAQVVKVPIIGVGGIATAEDALEFIIVGATAVAMGTANFISPDAPLKVIDGIVDYMRQNGISDINDLRGKLILKDSIPEDEVINEKNIAKLISKIYGIPNNEQIGYFLIYTSRFGLNNISEVEKILTDNNLRAELNSIYKKLLGREPDPVGHFIWGYYNKIRNFPFAKIEERIKKSPEYQRFKNG